MTISGASFAAFQARAQGAQTASQSQQAPAIDFSSFMADSLREARQQNQAFEAQRSEDAWLQKARMADMRQEALAQERAQEKALADAKQRERAREEGDREKADAEKAAEENAGRKAGDEAAAEQAAAEKAQRERATQDKAAEDEAKADTTTSQTGSTTESGETATANAANQDTKTQNTKTDESDSADDDRADTTAAAYAALQLALTRIDAIPGQTGGSNASNDQPTASNAAGPVNATLAAARADGGQQAEGANANQRQNIVVKLLNLLAGNGTGQTGSAGQNAAPTGGEQGAGQSAGKGGDTDVRAALEKAQQQRQILEELRRQGVRLQTAENGQNGHARGGRTLSGATAFAALIAAQDGDGNGQTGRAKGGNTLQQGAGRLTGLFSSAGGDASNSSNTAGTQNRGDSTLFGRLLAGSGGTNAARSDGGGQAGSSLLPGNGANGNAQAQLRMAGNGAELAQTRTGSPAQSGGQTAQAGFGAQTGSGAQAGPSSQVVDPLLNGGQGNGSNGNQVSGTQVSGTGGGQTGGPSGMDTGSANARAAQSAQGSTRQAPSQPVQQQVAVHVSRAAQAGQSQMSVKLHPAELGRVDVRLDIGDDGRVRASLTVDKPETLDMLQRDVRSLEKALNDAGLQAKQEDLAFNLRDQGGQQGNGSFDGTLNGDGSETDRDEAEDEAAAQAGILGETSVNISI